MTTLLELVYTYRRLMSRVDAGVGLELEDILRITEIEQRFARVEPGAAGSAERIAMTVTLRSERLGDEVAMVRLSPTGCECRRAPYADEGDELELVVEDEERALSYRFKARVVWLGDDEDDDFVLGLEFVGTPILIHHGRSRGSAPQLQRIAA